jgi:antitoxin HicB
MRNFVYPAILISEKRGGFTVRFPDLPEAITSGRDRPDALAEAYDCLEEAIAARISDQLAIPSASLPRRKEVLVPLSAPMAAKAALYLAIKDASLSNSELARRLGLDEREIRRMLDPRHATRLARIQTVLEFLGKRLLVSMDSAA